MLFYKYITWQCFVLEKLHFESARLRINDAIFDWTSAVVSVGSIGKYDRYDRYCKYPVFR